jgi:hypothetical protein
MRVAVCLSGQPRTWKKAGRFWEAMFSSHTVSFDVFFHFWNFNSQSLTHQQTTTNTCLYQSELDEIVAFYNPISHVFEGEDIDPSAMLYDMMARKEHPYPYSAKSDPLLYRHCSQFYGLEYAAYLKRSYEIDNDFEYDICIRARPDLVFVDDGLAAMSLPLPNTIYTIHTHYEPKFREHRVGDLFFYSDSVTFDKISHFYRGLSLMKESIYGTGVYPEIALMKYIKFLNIDISPMHSISPKVLRSGDEFSSDELGDYETI